jgi:hypothetical protein
VDLEIRVPGLVNLEDSLTNVYWIGGTAAHPQGVNWHVVPGVDAALQSIADTLRSSYGGQTLYLQYNDASLPWGGTFTVIPDPLEDPFNSDGHLAHATGLDIDIGYCYAERSGDDGQANRVHPGNNGDCSGRPELLVPETDLSRAAEDQNGVNLRHGSIPSRYHYHIRFRD